MGRDIIISQKNPSPLIEGQREKFGVLLDKCLPNDSRVNLHLTDRAMYKLLRYLRLKRVLLDDKSITNSPSDMLVLHLLRAITKKQPSCSILASDLGLNNNKIIDVN